MTSATSVQSDSKAERGRTRGALTLGLALALVAMLIAGCGGSSNSGSTSSATTTPAATSSTSNTASASSSSETANASNGLSLEANKEGELKYDKKSLSANAGKVSIAFTNASPLMHNMTIESSAGKIVGATPTFQGGSKTLSVDLKPGTYKFFCSAPGHRTAGMEGTLTVH
jgi:plastocyanin